MSNSFEETETCGDGNGAGNDQQGDVDNALFKAAYAADALQVGLSAALPLARSIAPKHAPTDKQPTDPPPELRETPDGLTPAELAWNRMAVYNELVKTSDPPLTLKERCTLIIDLDLRLRQFADQVRKLADDGRDPGTIAKTVLDFRINGARIEDVKSFIETVCSDEYLELRDAADRRNTRNQAQKKNSAK